MYVYVCGADILDYGIQYKVIIKTSMCDSVFTPCYMYINE